MSGNKRICNFNKFGFCKFGKASFRKHEDVKCDNDGCEIWECSFRHPKSCRYFQEYRKCKFGDYCKFSHDLLVNGNDKEISEIKAKLEDLRLGIINKEKEIEIKNKQIDSIEMRFDERLLELEKKNEGIEKELKKLKDENVLLRNTLTVKDKVVVEAASDDNLKDGVQEIDEEVVEIVNGAEDVVVVEDLDKETVHKCERCDFIGKNEGGLKTHITTKHKTVSLKGYRKIT